MKYLLYSQYLKYLRKLLNEFTEVTEKGQTWGIFSYQAEGSRTGR